MENVEVCEPRDAAEAVSAGGSYTRSEEMLAGIMGRRALPQSESSDAGPGENLRDTPEQCRALEQELGEAIYQRVDAPATREE